MCVSVNREIKHPFQDKAISLITYTLSICRIAKKIFMWEYFLCAHVTWCRVERLIVLFNHYRDLSEGVSDAL